MSALPHRRFPTLAAEMETIEIRGDMIRLGQLLKLAGIVGAGSDVKLLLASVTITVNGEPENRRGRQLHPGDVIDIDGQQITVAGAA